MNLLIAAICLSAAILVPIVSANGNDRKLVVISLDALMFSQIERENTPNIWKFTEEGVYCPEVEPVFPTVTIPSHFSIATGLYPGSHHVTGRKVYDDVEKKTLNIKEPELFHLNPNITPIWTLNEIAGKKSAVSMWISSEFEFKGRQLSYVDEFDRKKPWDKRIDEITEKLKKKRFNFAMFYSEWPDRTEHSYSADSDEAKTKLNEMDNMVGYFTGKLKNAGILEKTDIIILSDHGMATFTKDDEIDLKHFEEDYGFKFFGDSAMMQVFADEKRTEAICNALKKEAGKNGNFNAYMRAELPEHWNLGEDTRYFGSCVVVAEPGWVFHNIRTFYERSLKENDLGSFGYHGYDNHHKSMQATFLAKGPRFNQGVQIEKMYLIDYYRLFARLLGIEKHITNEMELDGSDETMREEVWRKMLKDVAGPGSSH